MSSFSCLMRRLVVGTTAALLCSVAAMAVTPTQKAQARARYQQDMAICNSTQSNQEPATCRLEARNALAEALRGKLADSNPDQYRENALRRCDVYQGTDHAECIQRLGPDSNMQGSVRDGGILRENITITPAN